MARITLDKLLSMAGPKLAAVHPQLAAAGREIIRRAYAEGINVIITQGLRTKAEQNALYAQGRTAPGQIVTNARGGYSYHNYGLAIDYALLADDGVTVLWEVNSKWRRVAALGKQLGLEWGGDWTGFVDYPHLQLTFGYSINQLLAGVKLPAYGEEDDEVLKDEIEKLKQEVAALKAQMALPEVPGWAADAIKVAVAAELIDTPTGGSYDFYRLLTVLHRKGVI